MVSNAFLTTCRVNSPNSHNSLTTANTAWPIRMILRPNVVITRPVLKFYHTERHASSKNSVSRPQKTATSSDMVICGGEFRFPTCVFRSDCLICIHLCSLVVHKLLFSYVVCSSRYRSWLLLSNGQQKTNKQIEHGRQRCGTTLNAKETANDVGNCWCRLRIRERTRSSNSPKCREISRLI